jgi:hypothetical protein
VLTESPAPTLAEQAGAPVWQARRIPHFRIVSPTHFVAPESGRVVVGGFNQYRSEDLQRPETVYEKQMAHFFTSWGPEAWFKPGECELSLGRKLFVSHPTE